MKNKIIIAIILIIAGCFYYWQFANKVKPAEKPKNDVKVDVNKIGALSEDKKKTDSSFSANTKKVKTTNNNLPVTNPVGNTFEKAKRKLEKVYSGDKNKMERVDIYCGCNYTRSKKTDASCAYKAQTKGKNRAASIEWEHVIPAENFGQGFKEWREGNKKLCGDKKGRECAKKNADFARMEGDMYNLYPAIGEVNGLRSNFRYLTLSKNDPNVTEIPNCQGVLINKKDRSFMPPAKSLGELARVYLYFDVVYKDYNLSAAQKEMFTSWSNANPISANECRRYFLIREEQKSDNPILAYECKKMLDEANAAAGK